LHVLRQNYVQTVDILKALILQLITESANRMGKPRGSEWLRN